MKFTDLMNGLVKGDNVELNTLLKSVMEETDPIKRTELIDSNQELITKFSEGDEDGDGGEWKEKYTSLESKYIERFTSKPEPTKTETKLEGKEKEIAEAKEMTFDAIYEEEGITNG